jgi:hypothetical protein
MLARTLTNNFTTNKHEFEMTENEEGEISFEKTCVTSSPPSHSRPRFFAAFFSTFLSIQNRILSSSPHHDSLLEWIRPHFRDKFFFVPGIL